MLQLILHLVLHLMADDHYRIGVEDVEDDDDDSSGDGDELYDVNKEPNLGEAEDQAQDALERMLDEFEIVAEQAPPIENAMVGKPIGKWRRQYAVQVGICARKIPITLRLSDVPIGLIDTFWNDTRSLFNIPNEYAKRRVFESLLATTFRGFKTTLVCRFITKKLVRKPKNKKGGGMDDEVIDEEKLPWKIWPSVSKEDWDAFVLQKSKKEAIEIREQNSKNALQKQYYHRMGCMTFDEWRETWVSEGLYPTALLGPSTVPSDSTTSTLVSRAGDFFCSLHSRDKKTGKWSIKTPKTKEKADKLVSNYEL
ncbi:uncharacterized protein LOC110685139 [Chenopodium quinoa]|uniref:uncharacterized protein LOC110685139 n=1 Tax=Chenopodium quinoa TaxID=63459 RepID=UPI000B786BE4|nr:uncharacterized protein LOC110685139 [Chenopodium quinoa]